MTFYFPTPTASPFDDIEQYKELLLAAIEAYLDVDAIWEPGEEVTARDYMEELKEYVIGLTNS